MLPIIPSQKPMMQGIYGRIQAANAQIDGFDGLAKISIFFAFQGTT
jgi:hypothetical protein